MSEGFQWSVWRARLVLRFLEATNQLRLPGPSVLPVAGAVVGLYAGLAAGIFANLISLVSGLVFGLPKLLRVVDGPDQVLSRLTETLGQTRWHPEYAIVGLPLVAGALTLARLIRPGGPRDEVKKRLRILALLVAGALALYYPLVFLASLNSAFGVTHEVSVQVSRLPFWVVLLAPMLGGLVVGRMLRNHPETHGHGVPEVVQAVKRQQAVAAEGGLMKLIASSITIGSGGSAGREGPIVYGGAAFAGKVAQTLGFSRKELSILMACGAGAGIAASFNAPIAGAIFAMEIILREFQLKVFSPIILASVTATMVGRGVMGSAPMLERLGYDMVSGWEILAYVLLGLICGLLAYGFLRLLHRSERFFNGKSTGWLSGWIGRKPLAVRAGVGGLLVGALALANPAAWGTGHDFVNLAHQRQLTLGFLVLACAVKILATALTIGSGGSGGTFFPATVFGAMAGGAFGEVLHDLFPSYTATSGAYAMVGMGGAVAGLNRGALTGMMMVYELSGNYAIILPLMVTCTIASALCHAMIERRGERLRSDEELLRETLVRELMVEADPIPEELPLREVADRLLSTGEGALPLVSAAGGVVGIVEVDQLRAVWADAEQVRVLRAADVGRRMLPVSPEDDLATALERMDEADVDAIAVVGGPRYALLSRAIVRRFVYRERTRLLGRGERPFSATELKG